MLTSYSITQRTWLYSTISPGCAIMRMILPSHGALISFMIFIASMMQMGIALLHLLTDQHERRFVRRRRRIKRADQRALHLRACRKLLLCRCRVCALCCGCCRRRRCGCRRCYRCCSNHRSRFSCLNLEFLRHPVRARPRPAFFAASASISSSAMSFNSLMSIFIPS